MPKFVIFACIVLLAGCETLSEMGPSYPDTRREHNFQSLNDGGASVRLIQVDSYWNDGSHALQTMQYEVTNHRAQLLCFGIRLTNFEADLDYMHNEAVMIAPGATEVVAYAQGSRPSVPIAIEEWDYLWTDDPTECM